MAIDSLRTAGPAVTPTTAATRLEPVSPPPGLRPLTPRDRFVSGLGPGALGGTKSAMFMAIPIAALSFDASCHFLPKALKAAMPFTSSAASIATTTLVLAGTGALVGGVVAMTTHDDVWAPVMGAATGGIVLGGLRGLQTKSWQGAVAGLVIGGLTGYLSGKAVAAHKKP